MCRNETGKKVWLGYFDSKEEAFIAYKSFKEDVIKKVARDYVDKIPKRVYEAILNYKVEKED